MTKQGSTEHSAVVDEVHASFNLAGWFTEFRSHVAERNAPEERDDPRLLPLRETILEALSDSSAEQFLSPLAAQHLRRYGWKWAADRNVWFWVRTEWGKVDLCYGAAPAEGFEGKWNPAWSRGATGDLGQIEVKVCYVHESPSDRLAKMRVLSEQLKARRHYDQTTRGNRGTRKQRYHGLTWMFQHGRTNDGFAGACDEILSAAKAHDLELVVDFERISAHHEMGRLWPAFGGGDYACVLDLAFFELTA